MPIQELGIDYLPHQLNPLPEILPTQLVDKPLTNGEKLLAGKIRKTYPFPGRPVVKSGRSTDEELIAQFIATTPGTPSFIDTDEGRVNGMLIDTEDQDTWFLGVRNLPLIPLPETPYLLNGASEDLTRRQTVVSFKKNDFSDHDRTRLFLGANVEIIDTLLMGRKEIDPGNAVDSTTEPAEDKPDDATPKIFREVDLNDFAIEREGEEEIPSLKLRHCGQIDILVVGRRGVNIPIEIGRTNDGKSRQLAKLTKGLKAMYQEHQPTLPEIYPVIAVYVPDSSPMTVIFEPPAEHYFPGWAASKQEEIVLYEQQ